MRTAGGMMAGWVSSGGETDNGELTIDNERRRGVGMVVGAVEVGIVSVAAAQYAKFREQVAREGKVFTFTEGGDYLVFDIRGQEVVPFWSSRGRLVAVQKRLAKYRKYEICEMELREFLEWLPELAEQRIHIGVNWSGERLTGYEVSPGDLRVGIEYWLTKLGLRE